ncbi:MAG: hypothetical protein ABEI97_03380, partial [Candidatus Nanohaloarchaea archaeon]
QRNAAMLNEDRALRDRAGRIADLLVRGPGVPSNWTADTVELVGLTEPDHVIKEGKLDAFANLSYAEQRDLLRTREHDFHLQILRGRGTVGPVIGDQPVALIVEESASPSDVYIHTVLNESDVRWDLYWPSSSGDNVVSSLTARTVYNYTTDGSAMFDDLLRNASSGSYGTIIGENTNLDADDIQNEDLLKGFVENGSSYLHTAEKPELLAQVFDVDDVSVGSGNGTVRTVSLLLNASFDVGDFVQFEDEHAAFTNVSTEFVNDTAEPYGCLACGWDVGNGSLYYVADARAENAPTVTTFTRPADSFGPETVREFGTAAPDGAETVAVAERRVLVNTSSGLEPGRLELVLWR